MVKQIKLGNLAIGQGYKPVFIAEIGINHNGSIEKSMDMVDAAVESGANIVKFQHHLPEYEMVKGHQWQDLMKQCALSIEDLEDLKLYTEDEGVEFLVTPFSIKAAEELNSIHVNGFKTGSGECNNIPFLQAVASYNKPMLISTGMTSRDELFASLDKVLKINPKVILLNCTSTYPATNQEARLRRIEWLYSTFNLAVGQSDHTPNISTALGAVALGAVCIEKHFTLDKNWPGPDQSASILPDEFKQMVTMGLEIWEGKGLCIESDMGVLAREQEVRKIANHSIVAAEAIWEGEKFTTINTTTKRVDFQAIDTWLPYAIVESKDINQLLGKCALTNIDKGDVISYTDIA